MPPYPKRKCLHRCLTAGSAAPGSKPVGLCSPGIATRENPPVLRNVCIQANTNVVVIEPSNTPQFDFWLRISTLDAGHPVRIPITLYERARETLAQFPKLCSGVTLNRRDDEWFATFVVERKGPKAQSSKVVGVDIGMVSIVSTSEGRRYGQVSPELRRRVERANAKRRRKQQLNACLKRKGQPTVSLNDDKLEAFARNEIGRALNQMLDELPGGSKVALERLTVKDMRFKSRQMNRALRASRWGTCETSKQAGRALYSLSLGAASLFQPTVFPMWVYPSDEPPLPG